MLSFEDESEGDKLQQNGKVKVLQNDYVYKEQRRAHLKRLRVAQYKKFLVIKFSLIILMSLITIFACVRLGKAWHTQHQIVKQTEQLQQQLKTSKKQNKDLRQQVNQLKNKNYVEQFIREKYGYSKKGEHVYILPQTK